MGSWPFHFDLFLVILLLMSVEFESHSIRPGERLSGNQTLISEQGVFEMGFFAPPGNSHNHYIAIWYKGLPMPEKTVVWVANRDHPVSDPHSSWLELEKDGLLALRTSGGLTVWSNTPNSTIRPPGSAVGTLGDDGNFYVSNSGSKIWQSFDYPTDTWLPGAKFGYDNDTGIRTVLRSWQDTSNPSTSHFSAELSGVDPQRYEVQLLLKNGSHESKFSIHDFYFQSDDISCVAEQYFDGYVVTTYSDYPYPRYCLARYVLDVSGQPRLLIWWDYMENWHAVIMQQSSRGGDEEDGRMSAKHSGKKNGAWIVAVASVGLATVFVGITAALLIILRRRGAATSVEATEGSALKQYRHRDLRRATRNFTSKLGKGGFSTVYKGEFPDSTFVAVKELRGQLQEEKQLRAELGTLGLIQHKSLVRLSGFCLEGSKRFIVYDCMPNGSLESHLFRRDSSNALDWGRRYNIALQTARGLAYLHEECRHCIIHCDIKPENILLDAEFNAKVADFGLAKLLHRNFSRVLTTMRGTRGYLAPEWFSGEPVTTKVDVYSYGQVLFEIISCRRNMDLPDNELSGYFPALVLSALNNGGEILTLVDSSLQGGFNLEEVSRACKVACWCIQDDEKDRPTMKQVVQILEGLLDVGIPPIPQFFLAIAEASMKESGIMASESYGTSISSSVNSACTMISMSSQL